MAVTVHFPRSNDYGDTVEVDGSFVSDTTGAAQDPSVVKFTYRPQQSGVSTTLIYGTDAALTKTSTGHYRATLTVQTPGLWDFTFFATGTGAASQSDYFYVVPDPLSVIVPSPGDVDLSASDGSSHIGYIQLGTSALERTVEGRLRDHVLAADFDGSDAGIKIAAAIASLPTTGGMVDATMLVGAQSCSVNIFSGVTKSVTVLLGDSTISASIAQTFAASSLRVVGLGPSTVWQYTGGSTTYVWGDSGSSSTLYYNNEISGMTILGNASVSYGLDITSQHHSRFTNLRIGNVATAGMRTQFAVANIYDVRVSHNDMAGGAYSVTPVVGVDFAGLDANHGSTSSDAYLIVEGVSGTGIKLGYSHYMVLRGVSESNNRGLEVYHDTFNLNVIGMDLESNTTDDVLLTGCYYSNFIGINSNNEFNNALGRGVILTGGQFADITINANARNCLLTNFVYTGTITDAQYLETMRLNIIKYDSGTDTFTAQNKLYSRPSADTASANDLVAFGGNLHHITGTTQINAITVTHTKSNWLPGAEVTLIFDGSVTVKHNTAGGAGTAIMLLAGAVDFSATANDTLTLVYDGTSWFEKCRTVI